ncbi:hypothetical protein [Nguyenibacter sp. L1]|uniref:hypothetical protein n=1 Tax=Nguyenibacter sp. L1 TaxID=3049350 RepID=UPI002B471EEF|nr:hypothetical protein [Nguyenibacter sp. L1]WRH87718.1 hypothetical protein QN315_17465 [Nguyenibacter sp. L1]
MRHPGIARPDEIIRSGENTHQNNAFGRTRRAMPSTAMVNAASHGRLSATAFASWMTIFPWAVQEFQPAWCRHVLRIAITPG